LPHIAGEIEANGGGAWRVRVGEGEGREVVVVATRAATRKREKQKEKQKWKGNGNGIGNGLWLLPCPQAPAQLHGAILAVGYRSNGVTRVVYLSGSPFFVTVLGGAIFYDREIL